VERGTIPSRAAVLGAIREIAWPSRKYCAEGHVFTNVTTFAVIAVGFLALGAVLIVHGDWRGLVCLVVVVAAARGIYSCATVGRW
jgi:hypothetical protein